MNGRHQLDNPIWFEAALAGTQPAEVLTPYDRRVLMAALVRRGMTDTEIATHTRWTTYTTARIRENCGLEPNRAGPERTPET
ncbi:hypothetical protein [Rhodococcus sp. SGAir0479]|uniref:hypothetical protein n=1 Tax=Rhodococcus sp. SGAir0479 TaxID=2567884 RepID=UPI0010CD3F68|nr:hypothetical protein [Rhodococcus sp. SGAir0479]QCQ91756.1 hypothetical protein E7742_11280 [Rhodococcus sp. SGAir0479]